MINFPQIKKAAVKALINYKGKRNAPKWIVIESDDWGAVRTSSKTSYEKLKSKGYQVEKCPFNRLDALESNADLEALFETLHSVNGADGNPANITFNAVMTNPNFEAIKADNFEVYHYEHFFETAKKYPQHNKLSVLYKQGIDSKCITPQFHGREHVHVRNWMSALRNQQPDLLDAFEESMYTVHNPALFTCKDFYLDAWGMHNQEDERYIGDAIKEGLEIFEKTFGFKSKSAIAACFSMTEYAEKVLADNGVRHLQGAYVQDRLKASGEGTEKVKHFMGKINGNGQFFTIRNANFEPAINPQMDWVNTVLQDVYWAFFWGKPAIINSHRLNFIGSLEEKNRTQNLALLKAILRKIVERWPDANFVSSDRLSEVYGV